MPKFIFSLCPKHPKYKAIRAPKAKCKDCKAIWEAKQAMEKRIWQQAIQNLAKAESLLPGSLDKSIYGDYIRCDRLEEAWDEMYNLAGLVDRLPSQFHIYMKEAAKNIGIPVQEHG
jgi:hypothetical protein